MTERYIAFDVETPNCLNDRMSAIGITVIEGGVIVDDFYSLVNPEARFDYFNVQLTGITSEMAAKAPNFPALWAEIEPFMTGGTLVAHNAPFDMGVLAKCLRAYGIDWQSVANYACT
ncbi:MAG: exonuclease domain-containing protein, partial [Oscillospiraceae bacterium]